MKKSNSYLIIIIIALLTSFGVVITFFIPKKNDIKSPIVENQFKPKPTKITIGKLTEYIDGSGFKIKYPQNFILTPNEIKDEKTFSDLNITSDDIDGNIRILIVESDLKSVDDWFKNNKDIQILGKVKKLKLDNIEARQFQTEKKVITIAQDIGALITISVNYNQDKDIWLKVNDKIISNFVFVAPEADSSNNSSSVSQGGSSDGIIFLGEEIIE